MSIVTPMQKQALYYVDNTGGNATLEHFIEDHDPIGQVLWDDLQLAGMVMINANGKVALTYKGQQIVGGQ